MKKEIIILQPLMFKTEELMKLNRWITSHLMGMYEPIEHIEGFLYFYEDKVVAIMSEEKVLVTILKVRTEN